MVKRETDGPINAPIPLAEAARILGLRRHTLADRARRGAMPAERRDTPRGPVWYVRLEDVRDWRDGRHADAEPSRRRKRP